jgi:hypothetical protein
MIFKNDKHIAVAAHIFVRGFNSNMLMKGRSLLQIFGFALEPVLVDIHQSNGTGNGLIEHGIGNAHTLRPAGSERTENRKLLSCAGHEIIYCKRYTSHQQKAAAIFLKTTHPTDPQPTTVTFLCPRNPALLPFTGVTAMSFV